MRAVIMAGGFGTRMRPLTYNIPKPMVPVANRPIMEHIVALLKKHGFKEMLSILYYQPEVIESYFGDGSDFGVRMGYIRAEEDLGTAGSVRNAHIHLPGFFDDTFIIVSGDLLTDFDLTEIVQFHKEKGAKVTLALTRVDDPRPYGVVITDEEGGIKRFLEKPTWGEVFSDTINTGIYVLEPEVMQLIPPETEFDFSNDLFPLLMERREPLFGFVAEGYWRDIGDLESYLQAHKDVLSGKVEIEISGERQKTIGRDIWIGEGTKVSRKAELEGAVVIGRNCRIDDGVYIRNSVIGDSCIVEEGARIVDSVIWDNVYIGSMAELRENIIGNRTIIKHKAFIDLRAVISDNCVVGAESRIRANLKLWPHKVVEDGATLTTSLVWGDRWAKSLFGSFGVTGVAGAELTPEIAARLGASYGASLRKGSYVVASRDNCRASRMIGRAIIAGLMSTGVNIYDLEEIPEPVARFATNALKSAGGFHVRRSPFDPDVLDIKFFEANGMDIRVGHEKTVERLFFREDFRRVPVAETGGLEFPSRIYEYYREALLNYIDQEVFGERSPKIVMDYAHSTAVTILPSILGELNINAVSLNAFMDESKLTRSEAEIEEALKQLSDIVVTLKSDVGFMLNPAAERLFLVDERGRILSGNEALATVVMLVLKTEIKGKVAISVDASRAIDVIASQHGVEVIRTKTNPRSQMEMAMQSDIAFVGSRRGNYIFPEFYPVFDAMLALVKILEMMYRLDVKLGDLVDKTPKFYMARERVPCPWELKGAIMRNLIEETKGEDVELIDGVKVNYGDSWIVIIPDPDRPTFHITAESEDKGKAEELARSFADKIREWQR